MDGKPLPAPVPPPETPPVVWEEFEDPRTLEPLFRPKPAPETPPAPSGVEADVNDGAFGSAAYCHHRHHLDEHSTNFDTCPHSDALRAWLLNGSKLSGMEKKILTTIADAWPEAIAKGETLTGAGYAASGKTSGAFARLVRLGYVVQPGQGLVRAAAALFD
jgi:hypothetical protein